MAHERDGRNETPHEAVVAANAAALIRILLGDAAPVSKHQLLTELRELWLTKPDKSLGRLLIELSPEDDWEDIAADLSRVSDAQLLKRIRLLMESG